MAKERNIPVIDYKNPHPEFLEDGKTKNQRHEDWGAGWISGFAYRCLPTAGDIIAGMAARAFLEMSNPYLLRQLDHWGFGLGRGLQK